MIRGTAPARTAHGVAGGARVRPRVPRRGAPRVQRRRGARSRLYVQRSRRCCKRSIAAPRSRCRRWSGWACVIVVLVAASGWRSRCRRARDGSDTSTRSGPSRASSWSRPSAVAASASSTACATRWRAIRASLLAAHQIGPRKRDGQLALYQALDPELVLRRARAILRPPPGLTLRLANGVLVARGRSAQPTGSSRAPGSRRRSAAC